MIYEATHSAISSPVSADGPKPCTLQDGPMTDLFGLALAPVSPSALRASSVAAVMSATYGLRSSGSSASAALQASLVSKLPELLASRGLTMWQQTWKTQVTPLRRRILAHTASAHRTSDSGSTGWPTPMAGTPAQNGNNAAGNNDSSRRTVELAHWPTARKLDGEINESLETWSKRRDRKAAEGINLHFPLTIAAQMATWPTPRREDSESTGAHRGKPDTLHSATQLAGWLSPTAGSPNSLRGKGQDPAVRKAGGHAVNLQDQVTLAGWPTPMAANAHSYPTQNAKDANRDLPTAALFSGWSTPCALDYKGLSTFPVHSNQANLNRDLNRAGLTIGPTLPGSSAATEKPGQLNAAFSLWLMGYPVVAWLSAAPFRIPKAVKPASAYLAELESCEAPGTPSCPRSPALS